MQKKKWIGNYNDDEDYEEETDKGIDMPDSYFDVYKNTSIKSIRKI